MTTKSHQLSEEQSLRRIVSTVYLCQLLTFMLAGLPLLAGVALDFIHRDRAKNTWLESHFNWQIKTAWIALAGFAVSGITFSMGLGFFTLLITIIWMVYRITTGWYAITDGVAIKGKN